MPTLNESLSTGDANNAVDVEGVERVLPLSRYNSTLPTLTAGQFDAGQVTSHGSLVVGAQNSSATPTDLNTLVPTADGVGVSSNNALVAVTYGHLFNNTSLDRQRNNYEETVLASAARTALVDSADLVNYNARGVVVVIDATALSATPSVTFTIQGKSSLGSDYYTILASAAIVGTGQTILRVYPGITAAANLSVSDVLPRIWRVSVAVGDADSLTYSVSANYIL